MYSELFSRGVYFTNFEIAAIHGINFRKINWKPHPCTHIPSIATSQNIHPSKITHYPVFQKTVHVQCIHGVHAIHMKFSFVPCLLFFRKNNYGYTTGVKHQLRHTDQDTCMYYYTIKTSNNHSCSLDTAGIMAPIIPPLAALAKYCLDLWDHLLLSCCTLPDSSFSLRCTRTADRKP